MTDKTGAKTTHLDVTGLLCPMPVLRARRILDDMEAGEILIVTASDPASVQDMPAFCKMSGNILHMARVDGNAYIYEIEKNAGSPAIEDNVIPIRKAAQ